MVGSEENKKRRFHENKCFDKLFINNLFIFYFLIFLNKLIKLLRSTYIMTFEDCVFNLWLFISSIRYFTSCFLLASIFNY